MSNQLDVNFDSSSLSALVYDALVIGAGQSGLATGYHLQNAGLKFVLLDGEGQPGGSWPHYYNSLRLFSPARFSSLPGFPFPGDPERYPTRDETITYLRSYAAHFKLPITKARVVEVSKTNDLFMVRAADDRIFYAKTVIAASGAFHKPQIPKIKGEETFRGRLMHSYEYREPKSFVDQRVIVVGGGNSAVQIAAELSKFAHVTIAARQPVRLIGQRLLRKDVHFWWWLLGLDTSTPKSLKGKLFRWLVSGNGPAVLDAGVYRKALQQQTPDQRMMFDRFTQEGVVWTDGASEKVDSVIFATGFQPSFDYLAPLGALDKDGNALQLEGVSKTVSGLYFMGISYQRTFASATLRGVGVDASAVVNHLKTAVSLHTGTNSSSQAANLAIVEV